jgi:hypothetical protein
MIRTPGLTLALVKDLVITLTLVTALAITPAPAHMQTLEMDVPATFVIVPRHLALPNLSLLRLQ